MKRSFHKFCTRLEEAGLYSQVLERTLEQHVSLIDLYEGPVRAPSIAAARRDVYAWLMRKGKGLNEVARLFDRAPSGVLKLVSGAGARK